MAYIAACVKYALENGERKFTQGMYDEVMVDVVNFYYANKTLSGPVKYLESYIKAYKKDKVLELLEKNYPGDKAAAGNAADRALFPLLISRMLFWFTVIIFMLLCWHISNNFVIFAA